MHSEGVDKVLPETHKLLGDIVFALGRDFTCREPRANWLFHPDNICEPIPRPGICDWLQGSVLPQERAVLLEQTFERGAAGLHIIGKSYCHGCHKLSVVYLHLR